MKEYPNESKNKWTRIFKKKWFFPAVYLLLAAFLLTAVVWYQNLENKLMEGVDDNPELAEDSYTNDPFGEEAESVAQQQETIKMPVQEDVQTEIVTKFFDYSDDQEEQEKGLNLYNNRYYQSTGVDIASDDGESFDVVASLSGTVQEVKEDPLLGHVVTLAHEDEISTYYASLAEVEVEEGAKISQGDKLGIAGKNLFSEESGNHVHFELRKADAQVNTEEFFNESILKLVEFEPETEPEEEPSNSENAVDEEEAPLENPADETDEPEAEDNDEEESDDEESEDNQEDETEDEDDSAAFKDVSFFITA